MEDNKCENCGGEGLVHQGESIKKVCESCAGTGKSIDSVVTASEPVEVEEEVVEDEE